MTEVTVGIDLGTSGLRAVAVDGDGCVRGRVRRAYRTRRDEPGAAEQSVHDWWAALEDAVGELTRQVEPSLWRAVGLSAMLPTLVVLASDGRPVERAITWEDARAEPEGLEFVERHGDDHVYLATGQRVDGRYLVPMAQRLRRLGELPQDATVVAAKDHLFARLTGELATDPSTAAGFGAYLLEEGRWDDELSEGFAFPPVVPSLTTAPLLDTLADRWGVPARLPVVLGAADSVLGAVGLGVRSAGEIAYVAGTSTVVLGRSPAYRHDPRGRYLVTPLESDDGLGLELDLLATGSAFGWLAGLLTGGDVERLMEACAEHPPSSDLVFLPYLGPGEQGALWEPRLRGVLAGMTLGTTPGELARALEAGIVLESRRCIAALDEAFGAGATDAPIRVAGSSAASAVFRRDLADATGRAIGYASGEVDHSGLGAAILAARAVGLAEPPAPPLSEIAEPDASRASLWAEVGARVDETRHALYG